MLYTKTSRSTPFPNLHQRRKKKKKKKKGNANNKAVIKACLGLANVLLVITTFAGAFTLNAYFNITCPDSLAATLLHASSMLFLSAPFGLLIIHLLLFSFPDNAKVPFALFFCIYLQFLITGLALATAVLYLSLAFYYYSNTRLVGIGGIAMIGVMVTVSVFHAAFTTVHLLLSLTHQSKVSRKKDAESRPLGSEGISDTSQRVGSTEEPVEEQKQPVFCFLNLVIRVYESFVKLLMDYFLTMIVSYVESLKSGDKISVYSFYLDYWSWEHQKYTIIFWILLEGSVTCAFIVLSAVELHQVPKACIRPSQ